MSHFHIRFQGVEKWNTGVKRVNIHSILVGVFEEKNHKNIKERELFIIFLKRALSCHATMPSYHSIYMFQDFPAATPSPKLRNPVVCIPLF